MAARPDESCGAGVIVDAAPVAAIAVGVGVTVGVGFDGGVRALAGTREVCRARA